MREHRNLVFFFLVAAFLTACMSRGGSGTMYKEPAALPKNANEVIAEVAEGDFVFRLVSGKATHAEGEKIEVYAELEYVGDRPSIRIAHHASPFFFSLSEKTRGYDFLFFMDQPLHFTHLKKGEPIREPLRVQDGFLPDYSEDHIAFMKNAAEIYCKEGTLPAGHYVVSGLARFAPIYDEGQDSDLEKKTLELKAEVAFIME